MQPQSTQPIIQDPTFNRVLKEVNETSKGVVLAGSNNLKGVLISFREYEQIERQRQEAKQRFFEKAQQVQEAFKDVSEEELDREIDQAIAEVRARRRHT